MSNPFAGQQYAPPSDTRGPMLLQATWIQTGIATPFLVARVYARWRQMGRLGWDDYLMILSLVFAYITAGFTTAAVNWGFGQHMYYLSVEQKIQSTKLSYILAPFAIFSLVFGRVSFAVSLLVLLGVKKWRRWLLHFVIVSQFVATTVLVGIGFFVCLPVRKYWDRRVPGKCLDHRVHRYASYVQGAFNIFADLVLAVMPAWVISSLNLKKKVKFCLIILMGLGVFNMAAAIVYLVELTKLTTGADITYDFVMVDIWGLIQLYLVIVIASIPFLRPLFVDTKAFSWNYYRILLAKYSHRSQSSSGQERRDSSGTDDTLYEKEKGENAAESLPHIPKDRFVTTSLRHAGMESAFDRLSTMETVKSL